MIAELCSSIAALLGCRAPRLAPLSQKAREMRRPVLVPEELVGALQDRVHVDVGRARPGRATKIRRTAKKP